MKDAEGSAIQGLQRSLLFSLIHPQEIAVGLEGGVGVGTLIQIVVSIRRDGQVVALDGTGSGTIPNGPTHGQNIIVAPNLEFPIFSLGGFIKI